MGKIILFAILILISFSAHADLSTNPWQTANDDEAVQKVYEKRSRRGKGNISTEHYRAEESTVIDRTHAYIQDDDELLEDTKEQSFLDKVKNIVKPKPQNEGKLIANTKDNRKKLAEQKREQEEKKQEKEDNGLLPSLNIGGLTNSFKLPNVNATGMIKKFEKASGINLKSIAKQLK